MGSVMSAEPTGRVVIVDLRSTINERIVWSIPREDVVRAGLDWSIARAMIALLRRGCDGVLYLDLGDDDRARRVLASILDESTDVLWTITDAGALRVPDVSESRA